MRRALFKVSPSACPDGAGLAVHLALQAPHDGALTLDGPAHALVLAGVGIAAGLASEFFALLGLWSASDRCQSVLGCLHQLGARRLQQAAVGGVSNRFVLHRAVDDHADQLLRLDQLELDGHVDGLGRQFAHYLCGRIHVDRNKNYSINDVSIYLNDKNEQKAENRVSTTSEVRDGLLLLPL